MNSKYRDRSKLSNGVLMFSLIIYEEHIYRHANNSVRSTRCNII